MSTIISDRRPSFAQVQLYANGRTHKEFAKFHGCSESWVHQVMRGRAGAPKRFREDLARFLGVPESVLFPEYRR